MSHLSLADALVVQGGATLLCGASFTVDTGKLVGLVGPNGAGKTTAIRALLGQQAMSSGSAQIEGIDIATLSPQARARAIAYLPQLRLLAWPMGVREVVALGRFAYGGPLGQLCAGDQEAVEAALETCDLLTFADRSVASLSGGELARVHIARVLAAQTKALVADEPIAALDPRHALDVLGLLKAKAHSGAAVLVILHDLNWAARFCDEIILMDQGNTIAQGPPRDVLTNDAMSNVFGVNAVWNGDELVLRSVA